MNYLFLFDETAGILDIAEKLFKFYSNIKKGRRAKLKSIRVYPGSELFQKRVQPKIKI